MRWRVGLVGAGQLARMTCEAASSLGLTTVVLAARPDDSAVPAATETLHGAPDDADALDRLVARTDALTFDHEQVDLALLERLEGRGTRVRPTAATLRMAVDKAEMRTRLHAAGLPVPAHRVLGVPADGAATATGAPTPTAAAVEQFGAVHGWPLVMKAARGGYDGKGVWVVDGPGEASAVIERAAAAGTPLLVEEHVPLDAELAVVVARGDDGSVAAWPPVETAQVDGVCREVLYPGRLDPRTARDALELGREVAAIAGSAGVLAVELFFSRGSLLVNEIAARPHNSAHWTIEGTRTSQFENHLRAVLGLPLGSTEPVAAAVATVNVFGAPAAAGAPPDPTLRLPGALAVPGARVHLYGKEPRPGRKLGHVTVCGDDIPDVRARAWAAACALGTPVPAAVAEELG